MNPLNYQQPEPTWQKLQRQYTQPVRLPVPQIYTRPSIAPGTQLAWLAMAGSAAYLLWGHGSKVEKAIATSVLQAATAAAVAPIFQTQ